MVDNNNNNNEQENNDYIEAIQELKENTVAKTEYEKLKAENQKLLKSLVNGETIEKAEVAVDKNQLRQELFNSDCDMTNLNFISKALDLRDAIMADGGVDPFLPYGKNIMPTDYDIESANRTAAVLKECVEYADGDSNVFTNELMRRTLDSTPVKRK